MSIWNNSNSHSRYDSFYTVSTAGQSSIFSVSDMRREPIVNGFTSKDDSQLFLTFLFLICIENNNPKATLKKCLLLKYDQLLHSINRVQMASLTATILHILNTFKHSSNRLVFCFLPILGSRKYRYLCIISR